MPIHPSLKHHYKTDEWKAARARALIRAAEATGHPCCEWCHKPDQRTVETTTGGRWRIPGTGTWLGPEGQQVARPQGKRWATKVVLTVAHLDQRCDNHADSNLKALCQSCHLRWDRDQHRANAAATRRSKLKNRDLFHQCDGPELAL